MNFNNSACFGYGSSVTNPSFNETILKYFLQKYKMSSLHLFNSLARSLNCYGVNISFSPAFLIVASSLFASSFDTLLFGFMGLFNSSYIYLNLSIYTGSIMLFYNTDMLFSPIEVFTISIIQINKNPHLSVGDLLLVGSKHFNP